MFLPQLTQPWARTQPIKLSSPDPGPAQALHPDKAALSRHSWFNHLLPPSSETSLHQEGTFLKRKKTWLRKTEFIWDNKHYIVYQEGNSHSLNSDCQQWQSLSWRTGTGHPPLTWFSPLAKPHTSPFSPLIQVLPHLMGTSLNQREHTACRGVGWFFEWAAIPFSMSL